MTLATEAYKVAEAASKGKTPHEVTSLMRDSANRLGLDQKVVYRAALVQHYKHFADHNRLN